MVRHRLGLAALALAACTPAEYPSTGMLSCVPVEGGCCTAVRVGPTERVTAAHCVPGVHPGRQDVATLSADYSPWFASARWPRSGEPVFVTTVYREPRQCRIVDVSLAWQAARVACPGGVHDGESGSGVWGSDGRLVGVLVSRNVTTGEGWVEVLASKIAAWGSEYCDVVEPAGRLPLAGDSRAGLRIPRRVVMPTTELEIP